MAHHKNPYKGEGVECHRGDHRGPCCAERPADGQHIIWWTVGTNIRMQPGTCREIKKNCRVKDPTASQSRR